MHPSQQSSHHFPQQHVHFQQHQSQQHPHQLQLHHHQSQQHVVQQPYLMPPFPQHMSFISRPPANSMHEERLFASHDPSAGPMSYPSSYPSAPFMHMPGPMETAAPPSLSHPANTQYALHRTSTEPLSTAPSSSVSSSETDGTSGPRSADVSTSGANVAAGTTAAVTQSLATATAAAAPKRRPARRRSARVSFQHFADGDDDEDDDDDDDDDDDEEYEIHASPADEKRINTGVEVLAAGSLGDTSESFGDENDADDNQTDPEGDSDEYTSSKRRRRRTGSAATRSRRGRKGAQPVRAAGSSEDRKFPESSGGHARGSPVQDGQLQLASPTAQQFLATSRRQHAYNELLAPDIRVRPCASVLSSGGV
jgi:hypothetical protein